MLFSNTVFITGGAGFIGSALIRLLIGETDWRIVNIDKITYAHNLESLDALFAAHRACGVIHPQYLSNCEYVAP